MPECWGDPDCDDCRQLSRVGLAIFVIGCTIISIVSIIRILI